MVSAGPVVAQQPSSWRSAVQGGARHTSTPHHGERCVWAPAPALLQHIHTAQTRATPRQNVSFEKIKQIKTFPFYLSFFFIIFVLKIYFFVHLYFSFFHSIYFHVRVCQYYFHPGFLSSIYLFFLSFSFSVHIFFMHISLAFFYCIHRSFLSLPALFFFLPVLVQHLKLPRNYNITILELWSDSISGPIPVAG